MQILPANRLPERAYRFDSCCPPRGVWRKWDTRLCQQKTAFDLNSDTESFDARCVRSALLRGSNPRIPPNMGMSPNWQGYTQIALNSGTLVLIPGANVSDTSRDRKLRAWSSGSSPVVKDWRSKVRFLPQFPRQPLNSGITWTDSLKGRTPAGSRDTGSNPVLPTVFPGATGADTSHSECEIQVQILTSRLNREVAQWQSAKTFPSRPLISGKIQFWRCAVRFGRNPWWVQRPKTWRCCRSIRQWIHPLWGFPWLGQRHTTSRQVRRISVTSFWSKITLLK